MEQKNNHTDSPLLVTGASGFIGSFLVEHALEEGRAVWAAVRRTSSRRYLSDPRIRFIELDLGNEVDMFYREGRPAEANRLRERVTYDIKMIREVGYCSGIKN